MQPSFSKMSCLLLKNLKTSQILLKEGECEKQISPCSTFKIPLSLIGFDSNILENPSQPTWPYQDEYHAKLSICQSPHNPTTWMQHSCVWFSQVLTTKLGMTKFKQYINDFNYGNKDLSGDIGLNNGLTHAWLSSSLKILPIEQLEFLTKLLTDKLRVSTQAHAWTRKILFVEELPNQWKLYGKTGTGHPQNEDGTLNEERQFGWFIGWVEKKDYDPLIFVYVIHDDHKEEKYAGPRAKEAIRHMFLEGKLRDKLT